MKILYAILIILAAFIAVTLVRAAFFKAKPVKAERFEPEKVDLERACANLSSAIRIKTISHSNEEETDWAEFDRFHQFLRDAYPLVHKHLSVEKISRASLLFKWQG